MKTNLLIIAIVATLVTACSTGTQVTRTYDDDIYFSPKDAPPVSIAQDDAAKSKSGATNQRIVISQKEKNSDGTVTLNNDIYQRDENVDYQVYDLDDQKLQSSDTTVYYDDDSVKYVINNYYEGEDIDFTYRINRFHRPYFYDPFFYDDWYMGMSYYPFYSGYYGWGYDPWYASSWGWGGFYGYSPFAYGHWGYGGYNSYHYGYYDGFYSGYYNGYYGGGGGFYNDHQVARRRSTEMNMPRTGTHASNQQGGTRNSRLKSGAYGNESNQRLPAGVDNKTNSRTLVQDGQTRSRAIDGSGTARDPQSATIVNNRRAVDASSNQLENGTRTRSQVTRTGSDAQGAERRAYQPSTSGRTYSSTSRQQSSNYTPSYSKPRVVNQPNYNNNSYSRSSRPASSGNYERGTLKSGTTGSSGYSAPRSSSNMRQTYQSQSYQSRSSSGDSNRSSGNSSRSSGSDYSPSRSYSSSPSPSYDSGGSRSSGSSSSGSYSGGGSSRSSSGGGGGSGHRR